MSALPMTPVLISRAMIRTRPDGTQSECSINFGTPTVHPTITNAGEAVYYCPIQLKDLEDDYIYSLVGDDPLAVLLRSLRGDCVFVWLTDLMKDTG